LGEDIRHVLTDNDVAALWAKEVELIAGEALLDYDDWLPWTLSALQVRSWQIFEKLSPDVAWNSSTLAQVSLEFESGVHLF
jgi:hypothetical protein